MNNRTLLSLLLVVGFVGATSCGDEQSKKDAEIAALRQQLAQNQAAGAAGSTVVLYTTQTNTAVVSSARTSVVGVSSSYSTGTYTVTGTIGGTSTGTAYRE